MSSTENIKPLRSALLISIVGFVFVFIVISTLFVSSLFLNNTKQQAKQSIINWSLIISSLIESDLTLDNQDEVLLTDNTEKVYNKLAHFSAMRTIEAIDVYHYNADNQSTSFVVSYHYQKRFNKSVNFPTIHVQESDKKRLKSPLINDGIIEYYTPIYSQDQVVGYMYIRMNINAGLTFDNQLLITLSFIFILLLIAVFMITFRLERIVTNPMREMALMIQQISQTKQYSTRLSSMPYKEADILARNLNVLLTRTEKHVAKLGEAEQHSVKLNIELEDKVAKRTEALKESNQELLSTLEKLHQFQDQLVESEKMASLGDMVAGVAHEVNTPIGLGVTASTLLSDRLNEINTAFQDKTLKSSQLKRFLNEGQENVGIIYRNLKRAAELISSFKKVAVDQSSEEVREFNINELINEVLLTLAPQIKNTPYQISIDCPEDLTIVSKPGPLNQVLINLILNSIIHGFDERDHGKIDIRFMSLSGQLHLQYSDDGKGIDDSIKSKVFDPFTTTKRGAGGSGLGLHLVYNLVTQALGGNISLESKVNQGVTFDISFPLSQSIL
ncbi:sensor histidine kinase [Thalassotalea fusca]